MASDSKKAKKNYNYLVQKGANENVKDSVSCLNTEYYRYTYLYLLKSRHNIWKKTDGTEEMQSLRSLYPSFLSI